MTGGAAEPLLLLASASAGRRHTLERAGIDFVHRAADLDETSILADAGVLPPEDAVLLLARAKAEAVAADTPGGHLVLGCDSMLELDGELIGKPHTPERAAARWRTLRGRSAVLHSGHSLIDTRDDASGDAVSLGRSASTTVHFAQLSDAEIEAYTSTGEPLEVAGAFTIDGLGGPFITHIEGDPHAVVGLSLPLLRELLAEIGIGVHELWRAPVASTAGDGAR